jgi:hypothetical protein
MASDIEGENPVRPPSRILYIRQLARNSSMSMICSTLSHTLTSDDRFLCFPLSQVIRNRISLSLVGSGRIDLSSNDYHLTNSGIFADGSGRLVFWDRVCWDCRCWPVVAIERSGRQGRSWDFQRM